MATSRSPQIRYALVDDLQPLSASERLIYLAIKLNPALSSACSDLEIREQLAGQLTAVADLLLEGAIEETLSRLVEKGYLTAAAVHQPTTEPAADDWTQP